MPGRLSAIYLRPAARLPVQGVAEAEALTGRGIRGDHAGGGRRQVTLLGLDAWRAACAEVGAELDPGHRRANLVLEGLDPGALVGSVLAIGDVTIELLGELKPCELMDWPRLGLSRALRPQRRGGAFGSIRNGGTLRVGAEVAVVPA